ncbi:hypothetical protein NW754_003953 [Fusarium falciforme]|uniref:Polyketide cyclase n=1 Tax=Fusarium falciforme TaxID=195108 RepID=A0A9W8R6B8_9HYPO|nr:hypothetical protein NW754_003953 [Fusarium falciforme]KAJ4188371.1 hypothetical protein NW755_006529 [Fusarium falciforme]
MSGRWEVSINAPAEVVRSVFFDWAKYPEWSQGLVRGVDRHPEAFGLLYIGEVLVAHLTGGIQTPVTITAVSENRLEWTGDAYYVFSGEMTFEIKRDDENPLRTTFVMLEDFRRLSWVMMKLPAISHLMSSDYMKFPVPLKNRCESLSRT